DVVLSWKNLYAHNRKIIDPVANRYFFVRNPIKLSVRRIPHAFCVRIPLHPDQPEGCFRHFEIAPKEGKALLWVSSDDLKLFEKGEKIRLMELFNFQVERVGKELIEVVFHSRSYEEARRLGAPLIHWIPMDTGISCGVVMPDASVASGIAEDACKNLRPDETIQFERFGFVRVDRLDEKLTVYFAHR
ncbi:MAG: glutamate--tRNA ligase, partial [Candidatus Bathyarchaeia archaeon]